MVRETARSQGQAPDRLESWKEIAAYLRRAVTTVQRWEKEEGLPVHRHPHQALSTVFAYPAELDAWLERRSSLIDAPAPVAAPEAPTVTQPSARPATARVWIISSLTVALAVAGGARWLTGRQPASDPGRSFLLTTGALAAEQVSLSPDGAHAAYAARTGAGTSRNLYIQPIAGGPPRRLTNTDADDRWPRWSPDGNLIVFARVSASGVDIHTVTPFNGGERRVARIMNPGPLRIDDVNWHAWSADGRNLILVDRPAPSGPFVLYLVQLDTGNRRQLTDPPPDSMGDTVAAASPDGKSLAFVRWQVGTEADVYVASLEGGPPRRLTTDHVRVHGLAWTPDGREVVFSSPRKSALSTLWRVDVSGSGPPSRIGGVIDESVWPSVAPASHRGGLRIAYRSVVNSVNLMRWETEPGGRIRPVCPSTRFDWFAQLSPDGRRIAFSSTRSGSHNIWLCEPGGQSRQVTFFNDVYVDSPRWSPDGNRLLFTSNEGGSREVFLWDLKTQNSRPLTREASDEGRASFSRDGHSIYFRSNRSGRNEIWKMAATGGDARQITRTGAMEGFESPDGMLLYFTKDRPQLGVWSVPAEGGPETKVADGVRDTRWAVSRDGIYFVTVKPPFEIMSYRFDSERTIPVYRLPDDSTVWAGFTASYDGSSMVWPQTARESSDIAVLDGVR